MGGGVCVLGGRQGVDSDAGASQVQSGERDMTGWQSGFLHRQVPESENWQ